MTQYNIAMIGAGPAALYATQVLTKAGHAVAIFNRDIKHGGLAEFGIYPNKYKMKSGLRKVFRKILDDPNVRYFGHVRVGVGPDADLTIEDLEQFGFDAVIVAVGAQGTKWLGLPGEDLRRVYHAKDLVYHYNGLPPYSEQEFEIGKRVCVIGFGNVSLDIVHWLVSDVQVERVTTVARRGPGERAYTDKEMKLVSGALDVDAVRAVVAASADTIRAVGQDPDDLAAELVKFSDEPLEVASPTKFDMQFFRSPTRILGEDGGTVGLECEVTGLELREDGTTRAVRTGVFEVLPCDTVIFAIGDSIEPSIGLPLEPKWKSTFMTDPQPWGDAPDGERYMVFDPEAGCPQWGRFVVGWARKASDGLVGKARADAVQGCAEVLAYLDGQFAQGPGDSPASFDDVTERAAEWLGARSVDYVSWREVLRLIEHEDKVATERGLPEFKLTTTRELLQASKESA